MSRFSIIGYGKLANALAHDIIRHQLGSISAIYSQNHQTAKKAVQQLGQGQAVADLLQLPASEIICLCVPDSAISQTASQLGQLPWLSKETLILHFSGNCSSQLLRSLADHHHCHIASLHPIRSFNGDKDNSFIEAFCALEGSHHIQPIIERIFRPLKLKLITLKSNKKSSYHAASVFCSNFLIGLLHQAFQLYSDSGIDNDTAHQLLIDLARSTLNNLNNTKNFKAALTGPVARGDTATINDHLAVLTSETRLLYQHLSQSLIELTNLDAAQKSALKLLLEEAAPP